MDILIRINADNAAFGDDPKHEVARILRDLAKSVGANGFEDQPLKDANGNKVGTFDVTRSNAAFLSRLRQIEDDAVESDVDALVAVATEKGLNSAELEELLSIDHDQTHNGGIAEVIRIALEDDDVQWVRDMIDEAVPTFIMHQVEGVLGRDASADEVNNAVAVYKSTATYELESRLEEAEKSFTALGGRGVELADKIDQMRIALAVRRAK